MPAISSLGMKSPNGESQLQRWSSLIGIITAIIGNILISFALNIQRYAHIRLHREKAERREKAKTAVKRAQSGYGTVGSNGQNVRNQGQHNDEENDPLRNSFHSARSDSSDSSNCLKHQTTQVQTYLKSPYWWGGIVLMTVGEAGNFLAYGFAPASIVSPLGVVALISNCVIAPIMLKERFRLRDLFGVLVAVAGAVVVVLSAKTEEKKLGPHEIWGAITNLEFEIYMAVTVSLIGVLMWASPRYGSKTILVDLGLVGLFGGYTALSTKGVASMLSSTLWRAFTTPVTYVLLAVLVGTAIMQVRYVNRALQRFDSTQVIPVQFVMFTISVILGSAILYRDFEKATSDSVGKFIGGCLLTFFGVYLITSGRPQRDDDDEEEEESDMDGEERIGLIYQDPTDEENLPSTRERNSVPFRQSSGPARSADGGYDDPPQSRRSSRVSFAEQSPRPRTPKMYSNSSRVPSSVDEGGPSKESFLNNPWREAAEEANPKHPGLSSTTSQPVLPTQAQVSLSDHLEPQVPLDRTISHGNVHIHPYSQQTLAPQGAERLDRPATPISRHSIARMMPGPFISPLSGGLSAVVADTLRRGVDSPRGTGKRPKLGIRRSKSGSQRLAHGVGPVSYYDQTANSLAKPSDSDEFSRSLGNDEGSWSRGVTRTRSLSNTLGDLFTRGKWHKNENRDADGNGDADENHRDEEAGPSGS